MHEMKRVSDGKNNATLAYFTSEYSESHEFCFTLLDGSNVEIGAIELVHALILLMSDDFDELLELINNREKARDDMGKYYDIVLLGVEDGNSCSYDIVYDLTHAAKRYGRFGSMVRETKDTIINSYSWNTWVDTCRLYESIYRIPRKWIS